MLVVVDVLVLDLEVVVDVLVPDLEEDAGALVDELPVGVVDGLELVVVLEDPPPPPPQDVVVSAGPLAQPHTALAEDKTGPKDAAGQPAITQGPAVA
jgi:hypothetical protein